MKVILTLLCALSCLSFISPILGQSLPLETGDFESFQGKARSLHKSTMIYFMKPGCVPCARMKKIAFSDYKLNRIVEDKVLAYEADGESFDGYELVQKYKVKVYPTIVFFSPEGKVIGKLHGYQSADKLIYLINKHM